MATIIPKKIYSKKLEEVLCGWKNYGAVSTPKDIVELMIELSGFTKE